VPAEVVALVVTYRCSTMGVRSLFVELRCSLMRLVWHFSFGSISASRVDRRTNALNTANHSKPRSFDFGSA
jgi:hypothetical protein